MDVAGMMSPDRMNSEPNREVVLMAKFMTWMRLAKEMLSGRGANAKGRRVVAAWFVRPMAGQAARRSDNSTVNLKKGETGTVHIELPSVFRDRVAFTLMHDKKGASDKARAGPLQHGHGVSGDAHNWPGFGNRIYVARLLYPGGQDELWKHVAGFRVTLEV